MSWESSAEYYRLLNLGVEERLGGLHSAKTVMHSVEFAELTTLQREERWDEVAAILSAAAVGVAGRRRRRRPAVHDELPPGRRPGRRGRRRAGAPPGRRRGRRGLGRRAAEGRVPRHGVRDGPPLLHRPAGVARPLGRDAGRGAPPDPRPDHLRRARPRPGARPLAAHRRRPHRPAVGPGRRGRDPRLHRARGCSSSRPTPTSRSSPAPPCTSRPRSTARSPDRPAVWPGLPARSRAPVRPDRVVSRRVGPSDVQLGSIRPSRAAQAPELHVRRTPRRRPAARRARTRARASPGAT